MSQLALDVGGAHVKFSDGLAWTGSIPWPLWKSPDQLAGRLRTILASAEDCTAVAVTMTGELADCYPSKAAGVNHILASVCEAAGRLPVRVYLTDGRLVSPAAALAAPILAAASNWHALARLAGRCAPVGAALLIDVGSTTCDLIPLLDGQPAAAGRTDTQRLLAGELVYTGVERSPVCAVARRVRYRGQTCSVAQELFATMRDVYLVRGELPEQPDDLQTADGRPATRPAAVARLARMICADETEFGVPDAVELAASAAVAQAALVLAALGRVVRRGWNADAGLGFPVVVSGHGEFLARRVLTQAGHVGPLFSLADRLGPTVSRAATAYALAVLMREESGS